MEWLFETEEDEEDEEEEEEVEAWHLQVTWSSTVMMAFSYLGFIFTYWIFIT